MSLLTPSMLAGTGFDLSDEEEGDTQSPLPESPTPCAEQDPAPALSTVQGPAAERPVYPGPVMVFDVETRYSAAEVGGWQNAARMGVSVCVCWDGERYRSFAQEELGAMFALWKKAGLVVGFNSSRFDMKVLAPFAPYPLESIPHLDILTEVHRYLHYRVSLDNLGGATLGAGKSGDGLKALQWWREGKVDLIRSYCEKDVEITKRLWDFGRENGYLLFANKAGQKVRVPVSW
ncbi:MAG: ribonuclease H-like domain-containing protein [Candidatus Desulfovibrio faecigallinarum]|nr:ribonuclease H-like domain-containing protein [Candidatus Desulfovibrio faecigallinarum]